MNKHHQKENLKYRKVNFKRKVRGTCQILNEKKIKSTSQTLGSSSVKKLDININTAHSKSKCFACGLYGHSWKKCHKERTEEISNNYKSKCMQSRQIKWLKKQSLMNDNSFLKVLAITCWMTKSNNLNILN